MLAFFFIQNSAFCQKKIVYVFSDEVNMSINEYLDRVHDLKHKNKYSIAILLSEYSLDTLALEILFVSKKNGAMRKISRYSNRYVKTENNHIPIFFYSDFRYSTITNKKTKNNLIEITRFTFHGHVIYINHMGKLMHPPDLKIQNDK